MAKFQMLQGSNFIQKDGMHWVAGRKSHKGVCFFFLWLEFRKMARGQDDSGTGGRAGRDSN